LLVYAAAAPAAFAQPFPPRAQSWDKHPPPPQSAGIHTVVAGGMPGWQIALIAIGAALLAATVAVLVDRARAARARPISRPPEPSRQATGDARPQPGPGGAAAGQPGR